MGLDTLAAALGEDAGTLEDVYEPYLLMNGLLTDGSGKDGHGSCLPPFGDRSAAAVSDSRFIFRRLRLGTEYAKMKSRREIQWMRKIMHRF